MTFIEALEYAMSRKIILPADYYKKINDTQRHSATSIAGLAKLEQIDFVIDAAHKSILDGSTYAEFAKTVGNNKLGIKLSDARLRLIFRTNVQSAYNHGKWQQQVRNKKYRPWLMYHSVKDNRTRDDHDKLRNVIKHIDDPFWTIYYPLNGYNCRCSVRSLTERQMLKLGGETTLAPEIELKDGFATGPMNHEKTLQDLVDKYGANVNLDIKSKTTFEKVKNEILNQGDNTSIKSKSDAIKKWLDEDRAKEFKRAYSSDYKEVSQKYDLDLEDFQLLKNYTSEYDSSFNNFLGGNFLNIDDETAKNLMLVRSLLNESAQNLPVYDGTVTKGMTMTSEQLAEYQVGNKVTINSFFSVFEDNTIFSGKNNVLLTLKSKTGRVINEISDSKAKEILFLSPSKFIVIGKTKVDDYIQIILKEV